MISGPGKITCFPVKRAQIVMSLDVRRIGFQHPLKFGNGLRGLAVFGQHTTEVIARTHEVWIELDGFIELLKRLFATAGTIQHDT